MPAIPAHNHANEPPGLHAKLFEDTLARESSALADETTLSAVIAEALQNESINPAEAAEILLRAAFDKQALAKSFPQLRRGEICGNTLAAALRENWDELPSDLIDKIPIQFWPSDKILEKGLTQDRPAAAFCDSSITSEHFKVNFASSGEHRLPGYPDLTHAENLAQYLEIAYNTYVEQYNLEPPIPDQDNLIDIYVYNIDNGYYGYSRIEDRSQAGCPGSYSGYMEISNDLSPRDYDLGLHLTSAHELFHLFQYVLGAYESDWLKESTARHTEMQVWPEIGVPNGVNTWFRTPELPLWYEATSRQYAPHFWQYLDASLGEGVALDVWRRCCATDWKTALHQELEARGTTFNNALVQFALWNNTTAELDDGQHFPQGSELPAVTVQAEHNILPVTFAALESEQLAQSTGSNYIRFYGPASDNTLRISFQGAPELAPYRRVSFMATSGNNHSEWIIAPDQSGSASIHIPNWSDYDFVTMIVTNFELPRELRDKTAYRYSAEEVPHTMLGGDQYSDSNLLSNAPNPAQSFTEIHFRAVPDVNTNVSIYDARGRRVRELVNRPLSGGEHRSVWDLRDDSGQAVSSGLYLANLRSAERNTTIKVLVVR